MGKLVLFPVGCMESCAYAAQYLKDAGIVLTDHPSPDVTHLLLDVPSFDQTGNLRDGSDLKPLLQMLPETLTVIGGNLNHNALANYQTVDLLQDSVYLAKNAAITAECALQVAALYLKTTFADAPALILGWGRIGKCLGQLLRAMSCQVFVAARKGTDRAMLEALGYRAVDYLQLPQILPQCRILFNTVPQLSLHKDTVHLLKNCVKIDLASYPGMDGEDVIAARGLPGKYAPESSGRLIAETILRIFREAEL